MSKSHGEPKLILFLDSFLTQLSITQLLSLMNFTDEEKKRNIVMSNQKNEVYEFSERQFTVIHRIYSKAVGFRIFTVFYP